jgi:lipoprotein-anchoring transpeptidase ErfK/SrfK
MYNVVSFSPRLSDGRIRDRPRFEPRQLRDRFRLDQARRGCFQRSDDHSGDACGRPTHRSDFPACAAADGSYDYKAIYGQTTDGEFTVPGVDTKRVGAAFLRAEVEYPTDQPSGTVIVDPKAHYLYYVMGGGRAMRYGVGVGKQGFGWSGTAEVHIKRVWPDWYPPAEMIARRPDLRPTLTKLQSGIGMRGGPRNPITGRAMYLWQDGKDTLFRIHGTNEPYSIGHNASSGCIRMIVQDVIDLYARVPLGGRVIVLGPGQATA